MHRKFLITIAVLLAVAAGLTGSVFAQGPQHGFRHRNGGMLQHMAKALNLTEAQQTQIKGILSDERTRTKPLMQQLRQNEQRRTPLSTATLTKPKPGSSPASRRRS